MTTVLMRHPSLPPEQEIEVDAGAVPHHAAAGWQPVPVEELEARAAARAKATADALAAEAEMVAEAQVEEPAEEVAAEVEADEPPAVKSARPRAKSASEKKGE